MSEENKAAGPLGWLRSAKDKFRAFAYGEEGEPKERPRVGLALAGGFARGIAHIGVLRVLREAGIPIDCVAGTSVGALIAVGYCAGASLDLMTEVGASTSFTDFGRWTPSWLGLATNQRMEKYIERFTHVKTFEELLTPLAIATTDISAGVSVYYSHGPVAPPLRASCAYPGLFVPIQFEGRTLVDGFLTAPVPVEGVLLLGADVVIAQKQDALDWHRCSEESVDQRPPLKLNRHKKARISAGSAQRRCDGPVGIVDGNTCGDVRGGYGQRRQQFLERLY